MTEQVELKIPVTIRGIEATMSLSRQGKMWRLEGEGLRGEAPVQKDVFVAALGIIDGKKSARRFIESEGGENL